jgi:hypothetical protein
MKTVYELIDHDVRQQQQQQQEKIGNNNNPLQFFLCLHADSTAKCPVTN